MHEVGLQFIEQSLVVRDNHDAKLRSLSAHFADALGHDAQRVDVEARVGLVENRQVGLEHCHLHNFVALFFATRKPLIEVTVDER